MQTIDDSEPIIKRAQIGNVTLAPLFADAKVAKRDVVELTVSVRQEIDRVASELDSLREQAREEGLALGHQEALKTIIAAKGEYESARKAAEKDAIDFAFALAQKIVSQQVELAPGTIVSIVGGLLEQVQDRRELVIWVHPDDRETLIRERRLLSDAVDGVPIRFDAREDIARGGCVIETASGRIDGRLETQLRVLREEMEQ